MKVRIIVNGTETIVKTTERTTVHKACEIAKKQTDCKYSLDRMMCVYNDKSLQLLMKLKLHDIVPNNSVLFLVLKAGEGA